MASASVRQMDRPSPLPPRWRPASACWKGLNRSLICAGTMPMPLSMTSISSAAGFAGASSCRRSSTPPTSVNLTALPRRLSSSCRRQSGSVASSGNGVCGTQSCRVSAFFCACGVMACSACAQIAETSQGISFGWKVPLARREKSNVRLSSPRSVWPALAAAATSSRWLAGSGAWSSRSIDAMTAWAELRTSWLIMPVICA
ncbi:hypothetical protein D3C81_741510 [compost metagenome]